jgi:hypothetical protein
LAAHDPSKLRGRPQLRCGVHQQRRCARQHPQASLHAASLRFVVDELSFD